MIKVVITKNHDRNYDKLFKLLNKGRSSTTTQILSEDEYREGENYIVVLGNRCKPYVSVINELKDIEVIESE